MDKQNFNPKYFELCTCGHKMETKIETHKYIKDNSAGVEIEEYEVVCEHCAKKKQIKIEKREVK